MLLEQAITQWDRIALWGFAATALMSTILEGSRGLGLSRLSLPFLVGTWFTSSRRAAAVIGYFSYLAGGWVFAVFYFLLMADTGTGGVIFGLLVGSLHGAFLLVVVLPLLPHVHPRIARETDAPTAGRRLEPPGFAGLNYGIRTPLTTLLGHAVYGAILGWSL